MSEKVGFDVQQARRLMVDVDVMLVSSAPNFVYATGIYDPTILMLLAEGRFETFAIIPKESEAVLLINNGIIENAKEMSWIKDIRTTPTGVWIYRLKKHEDFADSTARGIVKILEERGLTRGRIGIEKWSMSVDMYEQLKGNLPEAQFCDIEGIFSNLRYHKADEEVTRLRKAAEITERGIEAAMASVKEGVTDFDIVKEFNSSVAREGSDVLFANCHIGPPGGKGLSSPCGHKIEKGDIICLDVGARYKSYAADLCRTAVVGEASDKLAKLYAALLNAQRKGIEAIRPGVKLSNIYEIVGEAVRAGGYPDYSRSMFGHSIGLECEEPPFISATADEIFEPNMVYCIEVPWYEPNWGSVSVEDTILITKDGYSEVSTIPRGLRIIK